MKIFRKIQRNFQDYGFGVTIRKTVLYLFRWAYFARDYRIYRADLLRVPSPPPRASALDFRWITPDDAGPIEQIEAMEEWMRGQIRPKLQAGGICLVATGGGRLAGFNLVGFGRLNIPAVDLDHTFRRYQAWSEQISVSAEFRGQGLASDLRHRVFAELRQRGIKRFYGGAMTDNTASLKLARRVGFREIIDIRFRKYFGRRTWSYRKLKSSQ